MSEHNHNEHQNDNEGKPLSGQDAVARSQAVLADLTEKKDAVTAADAVLEGAHAEKKRILTELAAKHDKRRASLEDELSKEYEDVNAKAQAPVTEAANDANAKVDAYRTARADATDVKNGGLFQKAILSQFGFEAPGPNRR